MRNKLILLLWVSFFSSYASSPPNVIEWIWLWRLPVAVNDLLGTESLLLLILELVVSLKYTDASEGVTLLPCLLSDFECQSMVSPVENIFCIRLR